MADKTPADVIEIEVAAKITEVAAKTNNNVGARRAARALADAGLLADPADRDVKARLIAHRNVLRRMDRAEAERDELRATVEKVREIHQQHACTGYPDCMILFGGQCAHHGHCNHCRKTWPCPTIDALDGVGEQ